jgi:hypothetical protein
MSDVKELIERLRDYHAHDMSDELAAAADALERLSAERDEAREALRPFADFAEVDDSVEAQEWLLSPSSPVVKRVRDVFDTFLR